MKSVRRASLVTAGGGVLLATFIIAIGACVGDDPEATPAGADGGPATGDYKGPCFPDGNCKQGLVCTQDLCLNPGEAPPNSNDASNDANGALVDGGDEGGATEGGVEGGCGSPPANGDGVVKCGSANCTSGSEVCCFVQDAGANRCEPTGANQCASGTLWRCDDSSKDCTTQRCCATFSDGGSPQQCSTVIGLASSCGAGCTGAERELCDLGKQCSNPAKKCVPFFVTFQGNAASRLVGVCL